MVKDEHIQAFLLAEFQTAWKQVQDIDTRRGTFSNFYNLGFLGVLAFIANLWNKPGDVTLTTMLLTTAVLVFSYLTANTIVGILESERKANIRYRKKINLIRENFLSGSDDLQVQHYMQRKELGIKDFTNDRDSFDAVGGTLKGIYRMIGLQKTALVLIGAVLWLSYLAGALAG